MKKLRILGIAALTTFALAGCQNTSDREAMLEEQIAQLEQQVTSLENENEAYTQNDLGAAASSSNTTNETADTLDTLTTAVNDIVTKTDNTQPSGSNDEKQTQFFELKSELQKVEDRLEIYEDNIEAQYRQGNLTYENARSEEISIERLEEKLDNAEDKLEYRFGYDD